MAATEIVDPPVRKFQTVCGKCLCSAEPEGDCPQVAVSEDASTVFLRTVKHPEAVVAMELEEWQEFLGAIGATHDPLGVTQGLIHGVILD
jgi:hypothetical protein